MAQKIVYLVSTLRRSGPTHQLSYIIEYLDPAQFAAEIITLSPEPEDTMKPLFESNGVKITSLNLSRIAGFVKGPAKLRAAMNAIAPSIIHTQGLRADMLGSGLRDWPVVTTLRNDPFEDYPAKFGKLKGGIMAWQQLRIMHKARNIFACSASLSAAYQSKYQLKIPYVQNGVDIVSNCLMDNEKKRLLKEKLSLPFDRKVIVSVGSLIARKDNITSLQAVNAVGFPVCFIILGEGPERDVLLKMAGSNVDLRLPGLVNNVKEYLGVGDIFLSSSLGEGLPNTVLESLSCGLAPVLSNISSHREVMEGYAWPYFFETKNSTELSKLLKEILADEVGSYALDMRRLAEGFSAQKMSETYQEIYRKLLK